MMMWEREVSLAVKPRWRTSQRKKSMTTRPAVGEMLRISRRKEVLKRTSEKWREKWRGRSREEEWSLGEAKLVSSAEIVRARSSEEEESDLNSGVR